MSEFDPHKLTVNLLTPATFAQPVEGRKYTLTHSDITGQLFLDIGYMYNMQAVNPQMRDEVLAEWKKDVNGHLTLAGTAYVDGGEYSSSTAGIRFNIFMKEIDTAISGIVYGDRPFYARYHFFLMHRFLSITCQTILSIVKCSTTVHRVSIYHK